MEQTKKKKNTKKCNGKTQSDEKILTQDNMLTS